MRLQVESDASREEFLLALNPVTDRYEMTWTLDVVGRPLRTLVLVSTAAHCLNDLLFRQRAGQLGVDIPLVLSNHLDLRGLADFYGVPFEAHPVATPGQKLAFEDRVLEVVEGARRRARRAGALYADPLPRICARRSPDG